MRRYDVHTTVAGHTVLAGTITVSGYGDRAFTDFNYDPAYRYNPDSFDLAPTVRRIVGEYTTRQLPFFLQDAGPDRWGAHLVQRSFEAHHVGRNPKPPATDTKSVFRALSQALGPVPSGPTLGVGSTVSRARRVLPQRAASR